MLELTQRMKVKRRKIEMEVPSEFDNADVEVRIRKIVDKDFANSMKIKEILSKLAENTPAFKNIDPVLWQKDIRNDKPLIGR